MTERIFYAPRLPADPLTRSECIRSFVYPLRALQAPCLGTTLGGAQPPENPTPRDPPTPPGTPPPHPNHPSVRVEGYSEWMAIPSGWLFQVHGCSEGSYFNSTQGQTQSMQKALTASVGSLYLLSSHNAAPFVRISPRSTPRAPQELPGAHQEHPVAPRSTREHPGALEPV